VDIFTFFWLSVQPYPYRTCTWLLIHTLNRIVSITHEAPRQTIRLLHPG